MVMMYRTYDASVMMYHGYNILVIDVSWRIDPRVCDAASARAFVVGVWPHVWHMHGSKNTILFFGVAGQKHLGAYALLRLVAPVVSTSLI